MTGQQFRGRLASVFDTCRADDRAALIGYLPTGFPDVATSLDAMVALVESGCDIIEVGVPYSDPGWTVRSSRRPPKPPWHGGPRPRYVAHRRGDQRGRR